MKAFLALLPLLAAASAAPQYLSTAPVTGTVLRTLPAADLTTATTSAQAHQIGDTHLSSHSKSVVDGSSSVHRFDSRAITPQTVLRRQVLRPAIATRTSGSYAVAAQPTVVSSAVRTAVAAPAEQTLFQTADGRLFALNTADNQVQPGTIFQTADGRFFSVGGTAAVAEEDDDDNTNDDALIVAERTRQRLQQEQEEEDDDEDDAAVTSRATVLRNNIVRNAQTPIFFTSEPQGVNVVRTAQPQTTVVRTAQPQTTVVRTAQPQTTVLRTAAAPTFVQAASPAAVRTVAVAPSTAATSTHVSHNIPVASVLRTFPTALRTTPFQTADLASSGYLFVDQSGVAYEF